LARICHGCWPVNLQRILPMRLRPRVILLSAIGSGSGMPRESRHQHRPTKYTHSVSVQQEVFELLQMHPVAAVCQAGGTPARPLIDAKQEDLDMPCSVQPTIAKPGTKMDRSRSASIENPDTLADRSIRARPKFTAELQTGQCLLQGQTWDGPWHGRHGRMRLRTSNASCFSSGLCFKLAPNPP
jgi:hypothetical protein